MSFLCLTRKLWKAAFRELCNKKEELSKNIVLCFDGDKAGDDAIKRFKENINQNLYAINLELILKLK